MFFESTKFTRIASIEPLPRCTVKYPKLPATTKATTFPQNIMCSVPGIYCAIIRYFRIFIVRIYERISLFYLNNYGNINQLSFSCPPFDLPKTDTAIKLQIETEFISSILKKFTLVENTVGKFCY